MRRRAAAVALAVLAVGATAGKCDTAHPPIGHSCSKPGRTATTDDGVRVVCSGGVWRRR